LQEVRPYPIFLIDRSSTGHTFLNTSPSPGKGTRMPLSNGDTLVFGVDPANFSLQWTPIVLSCSSRMAQIDIDRMDEMARRAGVFLTSEWTKSCTHLLMDQLSITPKLLCCVVDGGVPVAASFLEALANSDLASPLPDYMEHQPRPAIGADAAYATELENCVRCPRPRKSLFQGICIVFTDPNLADVLSKAIASAGAKAQFLCPGVERVASFAVEARTSTERHGSPEEIWVIPGMEDDLAAAMSGVLLEVGARRCLKVPLQAVVRGLLLGSKEGVHSNAFHIALGKSSQGSFAETQQQQHRLVKGQEVKLGAVKMKDESFPQTQEQGIAPSLVVAPMPSIRGSNSEAPATLSRKRDDLESEAGTVAKRLCLNGEEAVKQPNSQAAKQQGEDKPKSMIGAVKEPNSQEHRPVQSHAASGMAQTVSSFSRAKSEKVIDDEKFTGGVPFSVASESDVKQDGKEKMKVEGVIRPAHTLSSCGAPSPSMEGSGMPKILSINFDTPYTQPKPEDDKDDILDPPPKAAAKLKVEAPVLQARGPAVGANDPPRAEAASVAPAPSPEYVPPKVHPTGVWLPKAVNDVQKQEPLVVHLQGVGDIDIRVLRASVSKSTEPVTSVRKGVATDVKRSGVANSTAGGRQRNFKMFRKSLGQQKFVESELVVVRPWAPPVGPGLAEAFASHRMESESQLPPVG
jgi:hypothetical protein